MFAKRWREHEDPEAARRLVTSHLRLVADRDGLSRLWPACPDRGRRQCGAMQAVPKRAESYLEPLIERAQAGVAAVAKAVEAGDLRVDDELHLTPLTAEEEEPELVKLRAALDHRIGEAQLPDLLLQVDAKTRFSWIMLGREPRSDKELLTVYGGILAHGTSMSAAETARMIPQLSAATVRQAMRWAGDERRLAEASAAVLPMRRRRLPPRGVTRIWPPLT